MTEIKEKIDNLKITSVDNPKYQNYKVLKVDKLIKKENDLLFLIKYNFDIYLKKEYEKLIKLNNQIKLIEDNTKLTELEIKRVNLEDKLSVKQFNKINKLIEKFNKLQTKHQEMIPILFEKNIASIDDIKHKISKKIDKVDVKYQKNISKYKLLVEKKETKNKGSLNKIVAFSKKVQYNKTVLHRLNIELEGLTNGNYIFMSNVEHFQRTISKMPYAKQKVVWGLIFLTPWMIGFLILFLPQILKSIQWSFFYVEVETGGYKLEFAGLENYINLFQNYVINGNRVFKEDILTFVGSLGIDLILILIFSLLMAVMLNSNFKGQLFVKAVFFIPVVFNTELITATLTSFGTEMSGNLDANLSFVASIEMFIQNIGIASDLIDIVVQAVAEIFTIVSLSGIQILIFIAALQSIPTHLYEAAKIEGATQYEIFWKITFPMVTPMLMTAAIYTIIASFTRAPIYDYLEVSISQTLYGLTSAIAVTYFLINIIIVAFVMGILKLVVYDNGKK